MTTIYQPPGVDAYETVEPDADFPFGQREPEGGYRVGDYVGIIHSDHETYTFDNPTGFVTEVGDPDDPDADPEDVIVTIIVEAAPRAEKVFLIARPKG